MTRQISEHKSLTLKYFVYQLGRMKSCIIFATIFSFLSFPIMILLDSEEGIVYSLEVALAILMLISFFGIIAVAFISPLIAMKHLYTKTTADNILSLPLTVGQRFFGDICAGFGSFAVPFALSVPASYIVGTAVKADTEYYMPIIFFTFALMLMFAAFNTLLTICCGRLTEAILYPIALNLALPLFTVCATFISYFNAYGLSYYDYTQSSSVGGVFFDNFFQAIDGVLGYLIAAASPAGCIIAGALKPMKLLYKFIITALVMTAVFLTLGFLLCKKRPAQRIGQPFVFKPVYAITSALVCLGVTAAYIAAMLTINSYDGGTDVVLKTDFILNIIILCIIIFILMLVMELINYRQLRSVIKFIIKYVLTVAGGLILCLVMYKAEGFGITGYVPADSEIEYIRVNHNGYNPTVPSYRTNAYLKGGSDSAQMITEFHRRRIKERATTAADNVGSVEIHYYLKNGQMVSRYYVSEPSFWEELCSTEGYRLDAINEMCAPEALNTAASSGKTRYSVSFINEHNRHIEYGYMGDTERPNELISALEADLSADAEYGRHSDAAIGELIIEADGSDMAINAYLVSANVVIYESYSNTLARLKEMFGSVPTAQQATEDSAESCELYSVLRFPKDEGIWNRRSFEMVLITKEEYKELLSSQVKYIKENDSSYTYALILGIPYTFDPVTEISANYTDFEYDEEQLEKFVKAGLENPKSIFGKQNSEYMISEIDTFSYANNGFWAVISEERYGELDEMFEQRYVITPRE